MDNSAFKKDPRSITTRLVFLFLMFSAGATLVTTVFQLRTVYDQGVGLIGKRLEQIENSNVKSLAANLWDVDEERLMIGLQGILELPDIEKVEIQGANEKFSVGKISSKEILTRKMPITYVDPHHHNQKNELGVLVVTAGLSPLKGRMFHMALTILISQGIQIFIVCAFMLLLFNYFVTKHLKKIAQYLETLNVEKVGGKLKLDRDKDIQDEFSMVVTSINHMTEKLSHYTTNLQAMIDEKTKDISSILHTIEQGIFTILPNIKVDDEYSSYLEKILETDKIAGRDVMDLLFKNTNLTSDRLSQVLSALVASIGEESFAFDMNNDLLVKELQKKLPNGTMKVLEIDWNPIINDNDITEKIMVTVRNVTEMRRLQEEAQGKKRELDIIGEILAVSPQKFQEFAEGAQDLLEENRRIITQSGTFDQEILSTLFRNMHTLKGTARLYNFLHLTAPIHDLEQIYESMMRQKNLVSNKKFLLDQLDSVKNRLGEYLEINEKKLGRRMEATLPKMRPGEKFMVVAPEEIKKTIHEIDKITGNNLTPDQKSLWKRIRTTLNLIGTAKLDTILTSVLDGVPSLARDLGKETPRIVFDDKGIYIKHEAQKLMRNLFTHIIRNSLDHGIESKAERLIKGKEERGLLEFKLFTEKNSLYIIYRDDGKGLNLDLIRKKAREKGLIGKDEEAGPEDLSILIFKAGFSTAPTVTEISGRGVGMDAVKKFLEQNHGKIRIRFLDGPLKDEGYRPFEIIISLPKNLCFDTNRGEDHLAA